MKFSSTLIALAALLLSSCSDDIAIEHEPKPVHSPITVQGWDVGCEISKTTGEKSCYVARTKGKTMECDFCVTLSTIRVEQGSGGPVVNFSWNSSRDVPGQIKIDDNPMISYKGQFAKGEKARQLVDQMLTGDYGHVVTYDFSNSPYEFNFSLSGFKDAYAKMMQLYSEGRS